MDEWLRRSASPSAQTRSEVVAARPEWCRDAVHRGSAPVPVLSTVASVDPFRGRHDAHDAICTVRVRVRVRVGVGVGFRVRVGVKVGVTVRVRVRVRVRARVRVRVRTAVGVGFRVNVINVG